MRYFSIHRWLWWCKKLLKSIKIDGIISQIYKLPLFICHSRSAVFFLLYAYKVVCACIHSDVGKFTTVACCLYSRFKLYKNYNFVTTLTWNYSQCREDGANQYRINIVSSTNLGGLSSPCYRQAAHLINCLNQCNNMFKVWWEVMWGFYRQFIFSPNMKEF